MTQRRSGARVADRPEVATGGTELIACYRTLRFVKIVNRVVALVL